MVDPHVRIPCPRSIEPLVTVSTLAWFFLDAHVNLLHVPLHVNLGEVGLVTMWARVIALLRREESLSAQMHLVVYLVDVLHVGGVGAELALELASAPKIRDYRQQDAECFVPKGQNGCL